VFDELVVIGGVATRLKPISWWHSSKCAKCGWLH